jgi:DNA-binding response OmpR family regulator
VDDEQALRTLVARAFHARGYEVGEAADGLQRLMSPAQPQSLSTWS